MKPTYPSIAAHYVAEHDAAASEWALSHLTQYRAMELEAFPDSYRATIGDLRIRVEFLTRQAALMAGFPSFADWCKRHGLSDPTYTQGAA